jgi:hypothetical protein
VRSYGDNEITLPRRIRWSQHYVHLDSMTVGGLLIRTGTKTGASMAAGRRACVLFITSQLSSYVMLVAV